MGFDTIVTDAPSFPVALLPTDRRYRPDLGDPSRVPFLVLLIIFGLVMAFAFFHFFPAPSTFEIVLFYTVLFITIRVIRVRRELAAIRLLPAIHDAVALAGQGELS